MPSRSTDPPVGPAQISVPRLCQPCEESREAERTHGRHGRGTRADDVPPSPTARWPRLARGLFCWATFLVAPLGWFLRGRYIRRVEPERLDAGLVIVLPGIEGRSFLNMSILQGLLDADVPYGIDIVDWTTGNKFLALYHLRSWRRNLEIAAQLADRIAAYRRDHPGRPVWLIGHSGGGGMALLTAEALPDGVTLTGIVLLAAAVSPRFDVTAARRKVERGVWSFHSWIDCLFVGIGTTVFGTIDGWHGPGAGMIGLRPSRDDDGLPPLCQSRHTLADIARFNLGGHFGCVHRVFIAETIAPLLRAEDTQG
jgi:pimeloyl-ACP methyl ester carboxylesterase